MLQGSVVRIWPTVLLAVVAVGCGDDGSGDPTEERGPDARADPPGELQREVLVTRDNPALPPACRPLRIGKLALRFSDALNRGDEHTLAGIWSGPFNWFSVTAEPGARSVGPLVRPQRDRRHFVASSPDAALRYAQEPRGFHMRLTEFVMSGHASGGGVDVYYDGVWLEPVAGGVRRYELIGKGFVNCGGRTRQSIRVWSMAVKDRPGVQFTTCPEADRRRRGLVTCWRRG